MKKRVLSMFLAFVLSFSMMPMSAFAEETGTVTEQEAQKGEDSAEVSATGEDISGGNAVTKDTAVEAAQALINALPEEVTAENADELQTQLIAIDEAMEALNEEQTAKLDMTRLEKIQAALNGAVAVQDDGHDHDAMGMKKWTSDSGLPTDGEKYYLDTDVALTETWKPANGTVLCLNGHSITMNADQTAVITIESGVTFTLYDCNDSNMGNGKITHGTKGETGGTKYTGRGVEVGGTFYMYDGTISDNTCNDGAAGVYVKESSSFIMAGGTISGNNADYNFSGGGGVYLAGNATFTMTGGKISDNTATYGGGVAVIPSAGGAVFNMTGGEITGNKITGSGNDGGGVCVETSSSKNNVITVAGNVKIENNTDKDNKSNNVCLDRTLTTDPLPTITVIGKLADEAHIGVTMDSTPTEDSPVTLATAGEGYTLTADDAARFSGDANENYCPVLTEGVVKLYPAKPHMHLICGETCNHAGDEKHTETLIWKGISSLSDITGPGNYYLTANITSPGDFPGYDVNLCLNGYKIAYLELTGGAKKYALCDCSAKKAGMISGGKGCGIVIRENSIDMYGGTITCEKMGVRMLSDKSQFNMYGGSITGNTTSVQGYIAGGVEVGYGTFNMYGGSITKNKLLYNVVDGKAGGVYVGDGIFNMYGDAVISSNEVKFSTGGNNYGAAGVYVENGTFNMTGNAKISNNTLTVSDSLSTSDSMDTYAGGVSVKKGVLTVGDSAQITGNTKSGNSNNVNLLADQTIGIDSALTEDAKIGVTTVTSLEEGDSVTIAKGTSSYDTLTEADSTALISDAGYTAKLKDDNTIILKNGEAHVHSICNEENCSDHTSGKWKPINSFDDIKEGGSYYLKDDMIVATTWECNYDVKICLNGKTITGTNGNVIRVVKALDITDCGGNDNGKGEITLLDSKKGHGIYVSGGGELALWNGDITGITYNGDGSGVYVANEGKFTMYGGAITGNTNEGRSSYGSVYVASGGTFIMSDGEITGNTSEGSGGGVYVSNGGTFIMSDGAITGNTSTFHGGGVYVYNGGTFTMTGGKITGNNTTIGEGYGLYAGGVYVNSTGNFTVSGDAQIMNNYWNGTLNANKVYEKGTDSTDSNVLLYGSNGTLATITIGEDGLQKSARIGVGRNTGSFKSNKAQIATGAKDINLDYGAIFISDDAKYVVSRDNEGNLYLGVHQHNWSYTQSAEDKTTINATCTAAGCPATNGNGGSVTIAAPDKLTYDGNAKEATVSASDDWLGKPVDEITITYKDKDGNEITEPINAGEYTASITLDDATASVTYTIAKAAPTANDFTLTVSRATYNGEAKEATVVSNKEGMGTVTLTYYQDNKVVENPTDAGTYTVKISVEEGENYTAASELESDEWKFIIEGNKNDPIVELNDGTTYTYTGAQIQPAVTVTVGGKELVKDKDYTVTYGENKNVGTGTVIIKAMGNYAFDEYTQPFTIEKAEQTLSFEKDAVNTTYGKTFTNTLTHSKGDGEITYVSSESTVATVDGSGNVTIVGAGTTTITATAAATTNYKEGSASYTLTVDQATIYFEPTVKDKIYDGKKDADVTVSFYYYDENKERVELPLTVGTDYTVTGTFSTENAGLVREVTVTVTLTEDCAKKYKLNRDNYKVNREISKRTISIGAVKADSRSYEKDNTSVTISDVTFTNAIDGTLTKDKDYTVTGVMDDANAGTNNVTVTVTLSKDAANNYIFEDDKNTTTTKVKISQATAEIAGATTQRIMKNGVEVDISKWVSFNNTDSEAELEYELLYSPEGITLNGSKLTAANNDTTVESFAIKVTAEKTLNFTSAEKTITVDVVDKMPVGIIFKEPVKSNTVYGDPDFSLTVEFDPEGTVPEEDDNGTWEWESSNPDVLQIVSGAKTTTPTIKVMKAGSSFLTVTYTSDTYSGGPNGVSITVNPRAITADMIGDIPAQEYTGNDIKPTPEVKDGTTKLTNGTDFTYSYSSNRDAGTARLTITGEGNYTGTAYKDFDISKKSINGATIVLDDKSLSYTGSEQTVSINSVKLEGWMNTITYEVVSGNKATDAGEITLTIEGKGNYTGTATTTWEITRIDPEREDFVVTPEDLTTALTYDGTAKTVTVTTADDIKGMGEITVKYNGSTEAPTNAGSYEVTFEVADGTNYKAKTDFKVGTLTINKAAAPALNDIKAGYKYTLTGEKTVELADLVAGATGYKLGVITGDTDIILDSSVDANGVLKYTLTGKGKIDDTVTLPVTITSVNYEDTTVKVVITLKARDDQAALTITGDTTVVYGKTLTLGTTGGSGTGKVTYSIDKANSTGEATIDANGVLTPTKVGKVTIIATKAGDADYNEATSAAFVITITKASSTGEPKYTVITADGKTLADAGLTLTGSTLTPAGGKLEWIDEAGNELSADTKVEANKTYKWCFTPADTNYEILTGEVELWHVDAPAISAQPKNVSVITGEKATFEVTASGTEVTYQWQIDRNDGKGFVDITGANSAGYTTGVTDKSCDGFKYQCVIRNAAGSVTTDTVVLAVKEKYIITASAGEHGSISPGGAVEVVEGSNQTFVIATEEGYEIESLTVDGTAVNVAASYTFENVTAAHTIAVTFKQQYKIIEGMNGSWTQNTDGSRSIKIRGNGGFSKFRNVMVDGNIIDPSNYEASEGSTIIELHADYLKTLSEGIHTLAIVWTDGTASTNFTVAKNTADDDDDNDDNGGSTNTNTAGSSDNTAQTLTKSPKTGDASGLWIALFAASAAGLAVMLVRRKKY